MNKNKKETNNELVTKIIEYTNKIDSIIKSIESYLKKNTMEEELTKYCDQVFAMYKQIPDYVKHGGDTTFNLDIVEEICKTYDTKIKSKRKIDNISSRDNIIWYYTIRTLPILDVTTSDIINKGGYLNEDDSIKEEYVLSDNGVSVDLLDNISQDLAILSDAYLSFIEFKVFVSATMPVNNSELNGPLIQSNVNTHRIMECLLWANTLYVEKIKKEEGEDNIIIKVTQAITNKLIEITGLMMSSRETIIETNLPILSMGSLDTVKYMDFDYSNIIDKVVGMYFENIDNIMKTRHLLSVYYLSTDLYIQKADAHKLLSVYCSISKGYDNNIEIINSVIDTQNKIIDYLYTEIKQLAESIECTITINDDSRIKRSISSSSIKLNNKDEEFIEGIYNTTWS